MRGYQTSTGKWTANVENALRFNYPELSIPCNQCIGCRLDLSKDWVTRIISESKAYEENCFITLTFSDDTIVYPPTLQKRDFQLFMKRFRDKISPRKIKYYHVGEYGDQSFRPHHHAIIFNYDFSEDRKPYKKNTYTSKLLDSLWTIKCEDNIKINLGFAVIGHVSPQSVAYVARYNTKKITGVLAKKHYKDKDGNELLPEYSTMSRGGRNGRGIGYDFIMKYKDEVYPSDYLTINGKKFKPPKYYDNVVYEIMPDEIDAIKEKRRNNINLEDNTDERLAIKKKVCQARMSQYRRNIT